MDIVPQILANSLISGSIYALAGAGIALTYALFRILNFSHGHLMMVGAYSYYFFTVDLGLPPLPAFAATCAVGFCVSELSLRVFVNPFLGTNALLPFVSTLALSVVLESVVSILFGVNVRTLTLANWGESFEMLGFYITHFQVWIIISAVVLLGTLAFIVHCTSVGRLIRSISESRESALALGIPVRQFSSWIFLLCVILAIFSGILVGYETNIQPTMGNSYTIKAFAAMVLGGLGNVWGTIAGSYILGVVENFSIGLDFFGYSLPSGYKDAFAFLIILCILLFRPRGLFNQSVRSV